MPSKYSASCPCGPYQRPFKVDEGHHCFQVLLFDSLYDSSKGQDLAGSCSACLEAILVRPEERVQYGFYPVEYHLVVDFGHKRAETDAPVIAA